MKLLLKGQDPREKPFKIVCINCGSIYETSSRETSSNPKGVSCEVCGLMIEISSENKKLAEARWREYGEQQSDF